MKQLACQQENINGDDTNIIATRRSSSVRLSVRLCIHRLYSLFLLLCLPTNISRCESTEHPNLQSPMSLYMPRSYNSILVVRTGYTCCSSDHYCGPVGRRFRSAEANPGHIHISVGNQSDSGAASAVTGAASQPQLLACVCLLCGM